MLGKSALTACLALCGAAASLMYCNPELVARNSSKFSKQAQAVMCSQTLLSALTAVLFAALWGEHLSGNTAKQQGKHAGSSTAATSSSGSSWRVSEGYPALGTLTNLQLPAASPAADLSAAVWNLLSAQEGQLKAGQVLLPPSQQQLLETLGCSSKGLLWLAPLWVTDPERGIPADLRISHLLMIGMQVG